MGKKASGNKQGMWTQEEVVTAFQGIGAVFRGNALNLGQRSVRIPDCREFDAHLVGRMARTLGTNRAALVIGGGQG